MTSTSMLGEIGGKAQARQMKPNPSLEPTRTGMALGSPLGEVHHPPGVQRAIPVLAPQLKR